MAGIKTDSILCGLSCRRTDRPMLTLRLVFCLVLFATCPGKAGRIDTFPPEDGAAVAPGYFSFQPNRRLFIRQCRIGFLFLVLFLLICRDGRSQRHLWAANECHFD